MWRLYCDILHLQVEDRNADTDMVRRGRFGDYGSSRHVCKIVLFCNGTRIKPGSCQFT